LGYIEAFDTEAAVAMGVGQPARIFRTVDGGRTWVQTYHNDASGIFLDAMTGPEGFHTLCFAKKGRAAWAAGRNGLIARLDMP